MKPNALLWHFDRASLHLRRHGVERFFALAFALDLRSLLTGFTRRGATHSSLSPTAIAAIARA